MKNLRYQFLVGFVAAAVAGISQLAIAQPGEGRGGRGRGGESFGRGPITSLRLARADEVAAALKLTDEQKSKIADINDKLREEIQKGFESGNGREKMREAYQSASAQLAEVLDDGQEKRLMGILVQVNGASAVADPAVAKELGISDEQRDKLRSSLMESVQGGFAGLRDLSPEEREKKIEELREEANKKILAELSDEQKTKLESLKGEPVKVDMAQFRMGRNFGRGGESRGGREREPRDRDKSDPEKSSDEK